MRYHYTTVAADSLLEQESSKLEHGMINTPQIENCLRDGHYNFRDGLRQRWVKAHWCFLFVFVYLAHRLRLQTILNLWYVYHSMLELRAFLLQKGISCLQWCNVHLSDNFQSAADKDLAFSIYSNACTQCYQ